MGTSPARQRSILSQMGSALPAAHAWGGKHLPKSAAVGSQPIPSLGAREASKAPGPRACSGV